MESGYLEKNILINGRYKVKQKIDTGNTTIVYQGTDVLTKKRVAIKAESSNLGVETIPYESNTYRYLNNSNGFAQIFYAGQEKGQNIIVMELLGVSMKHVHNEIGKRFCLKTVLELADQMLMRLQIFHVHSVHCDLKPANFMMGAGDKSGKLYLVGFKFARQNFHEQLHLNNQQFIGNPLFVARNVHMNKPLTALDDLESFGYVLVYFITGTLPWEPPATLTRDEQLKQIQYMKLSCDLDKLCQGVPSVFYQYFQYIFGLQSYEEPNYYYLRQIFRTLAARLGYVYNHIFEWNAPSV
ncbi:Casein kinase Ialpha [Carabus blaptoides fortunei]